MHSETNLKRKMALAATASTSEFEKISKLSGLIECEMPNNRMNQFEGRMMLDSNPQTQLPLTTQQILLRGSELRNCDFIYGACIYAGVDTKIFR